MPSEIKILYVDDEKLNTMLFDMHFSDSYKVFTAINGYAGLDILSQENDIDIIISDLRMPELDGIQFISKAKEKFPQKKYFILSGFEKTPEIEHSIKNGLILQYFNKPFDKDLIDAEIAKCINR